MKKIFTLNFLSILCLLVSMATQAQTTVFYETCGSTAPASGTRPTPDTYSGWDNIATATYSGNVDVRSTGSLNSHVWFAANNDKNFVISGINTSGKLDLKISLKVACNSASGDASKMTLVAKDLISGNETPITIPSTPVGSTNTYVEVNNLTGIPVTTNLQLTFSFTAANNPTGYGYRLDDILISAGDAPVLSDNNNLASLSVSQGTLDPAFSSTVTSYSVVLPAGTTTVPTENYTLEDTKAQASVTRAQSIPGTTEIVVRAENGDEKPYQINFSTETPVGTWIETFEGESANKTGYAVGDFVGTAATWEVYGIVTSTDNNDKKNGTRSARLRDPNTSNADPHYIMMKTDKANGAGTISLYHGMYSNHTGAATWKLEVSDDGGATWNAFSQEGTTVPTIFTKISFTVNVAGNIRVKITKTNPQSAGSATINIDDVEITNYVPTNIESAKGNVLDVYVSDNTLYVNNMPESATVLVYDIAGKLIAKSYISTVSLQQKGIYAVKVIANGNVQTFKVINK